MKLKQLKYALMLATEIVIEVTAFNKEDFNQFVEAIDFRNAFAYDRPLNSALWSVNRSNLS